MSAYKDCFWQVDGDILTVGNSLIERVMRVNGAGMTVLAVNDRRSGKSWMRPEEECLTVVSMFAGMRASVSAKIDDHDGLSDEHLTVCVTWENDQGERIERSFEVYPGIPLIHMRVRVAGQGVWEAKKSAGIEYNGVETGYVLPPTRMADADAIDAIPLPSGHYDLRSIKPIDRTDENDTLLEEQVKPLYVRRAGSDKAEGNLFFVEDRLDGQALLMVKESPTTLSMLGRTQKDVQIRHTWSVQLVGSGMDGQKIDETGAYAYGSTVGAGTEKELEQAWLALYRAMWKPAGQVCVLSNTWGDRSQDKAICHDFMMKEIDMAARLGVQVVQIDDGWEKGHTANSALKKGGVWEGYYAQDPDFWQVSREKFPQGLKPLVEYAGSKGVEMGLWFSPDSTNDFANWRRDADTLVEIYRTLGIRRFKLDGVKIRSKQAERNFLRMLEALNRESEGCIYTNQDITAEIRFGPVYFREYGNLFVENRYSDFGSYYPHNTLKNLWQLSRVVPAGRLQMECLNRARNQDKYPAGDPLAPHMYTQDYLFAVTMMGSPLIWMEMSRLAEEDAAALQRIISVYREHQKNIVRSVVEPIGNLPDGVRFTGFHAGLGEEGGYLLIFREAGEESGYRFGIPALEGREVRCELLATNAPDGGASLTADAEGGANVRMEGKLTYAFWRYTFS